MIKSSGLPWAQAATAPGKTRRGEPAAEATARVKHCGTQWVLTPLLSLLVLQVCFVGATCSAQEPNKHVREVREEIELPAHADLLTVPVSIYGRTFDFEVDTGMTHTTVNTRMRQMLGAARGKGV